MAQMAQRHILHKLQQLPFPIFEIVYPNYNLDADSLLPQTPSPSLRPRTSLPL